LVLAGCANELTVKNGQDSSSPNNGSDAGDYRDSSSAEPDGGTAEDDAGTSDAGMDARAQDGGGDTDTPLTCAEITCGENATCSEGVCTCDDGFLGDPYTGCAEENPCADVECPVGSSCNPDGSCSCDPFFTDNGSDCEPQVPADPATRSEADVCEIWTSTHDRSSPDFWMIEPTEPCDPGVLHPAEERTALHRASVYRLLVGLYPVSVAANQIVPTQECAMMMDANNALSHNPPPDWECYTDAGAGGAGSSNIALGARSPAATVDLYIRDRNTPSLGHRRWIFNPGMGVTAFGHKGSGGCMYSFGGGRAHNPDFVAYPAPGPFPSAAILGKWSIHGGANYQDTFTVEITNMSDMSDVPVSNVTAPAFGGLASTLAWDVNTSQLPVDTDYRVRISDGATVVQEYTTRLVSCQ
jgi:hypothetical protein